MRVRGPLHSLDVRGRFGVGIVFTNWRGLSVARMFTVPTNPQSTRQVVIRALMASASRAWEDLTQPQRVGWNNYAKDVGRTNVFGQEIKTSGFNEYCALSVIAEDTGTAPGGDAPTEIAPLAVTDGVIEEGAASGEIDVTWTAGQGGFVDIWLAGPLPNGRFAVKSDFAHDSYTADVTATKTISGLTAGKQYVVSIRQVATTGQVGPWTKEELRNLT